MVLVDTSVWVDYLRGEATATVRRTVSTLLDDHEAAINPIIRLELLRGASVSEAQVLHEVFDGLHELPFEHPHWQRANRLVVELRAQGVSPSLTDLLIATTALVHHLALYHQDEVFDAIARRTELQVYRP